MARPVDAQFPISQMFAGLATRGVVGRPNGTQVEYLVWLYGDYQPYGHAGVDIACPVGTKVVAMRAGTVVYSGWGEDLPGDDSWGPSGYFRRWGMYKTFPGIVVVIKADGVDEFDIYGHLSDSRPAPVGARVAEGQLIAISGNTKTRTETVGAHLHVVIVADPVNYSTNWPHIIFGCVDPTPLFGTTGLVLQGAITNASTTQAQEEDDDMLVIARDTSAADPEKIWIGNGVTRRHIPSPEILAAYQDHAKTGILKIYDGGTVQNLPTESLGQDIAADTAVATVKQPFAYREPRTNEVKGTTSIESALGSSDLQFVATRDEV
jgi:murein DD-endopeptidase MepM/ murein hydrolase activator NlpD